jgi:hypothetical protein
VSGVYPLTDAGTCTVRALTSERIASGSDIGTPVAMESTGMVSLLSSARLHRFRAAITEADTWTHAQGLRVLVQPDGEA